MGKVFDYFRSHRKAVLVLAVLVMVGGTVFFIQTKKQSASEQARFAIADPKAREEQLKKLQQDSDSDLLRDWEEVLYHSDPHNSDTDGDGTPDGEEVKLGRDPAIAGPNDLMATSTPLQNAPDGKPQNLTRQLAEQIAKEMIVRRIANPDIPFDTDLTAQNLVDTAFGSMPDKTQHPLTEKDILIGRDDSKAAAQAYQTAMVRIVETNSKSLAAKPYVQIFTEAMQTQQYEKLNALDPYLAEYNRIVIELKKLPAPPRFAKLHLEYVNIIISQAAITQKMRGAGSDPLNGVLALQQYVTLQEQFKALLNKFTDEYQKIGI
ncbi:MAG: hypothetical protein HY617_00215 [Candidatus Sungbacteria bacterium]|nr:hypothetical protein [Candidatus Sungbacteria bacterium]